MRPSAVYSKKAPPMPSPHRARTSSYEFEEATLSSPPQVPEKKMKRQSLTSLALFDRVSYRPQRFSNPNLPAVTAGGLDFIYKCGARVTIPSNGQALKIPISSRKFHAKALYEATPAIKKTAFLKATIENNARLPILKGTANIFMGKDFVGQGVLDTTGPGGQLSLPLGADQDIRLLRKITTETETKGIFTKEDVTTYFITIEIGNYKKRPVRLLVHDQVPRSGNQDIKVKLKSVSPGQNKGPNKDDGVITWAIDLPPGQNRIIKFSYTIERPQNWKLYQ